MARTLNPKTLAGMIQRLQQEREKHQKRLSEIDAIFSACGIGVTAVSVRRGPGRPPSSMSAAVSSDGAGGKKRRRRRRGRFSTSGPESILQLVTGSGRGGVSSSDISKHWKGEGRSGEPYITLGQLVKSGKLKKKSVKGERGSHYSVA